jgi:hypothetical protein
MSVNKNVPLTLLVMSRAFLFTTGRQPSADDQTAALQEAVSQLDEDVIVDAVIEAAESSAAMSAEPLDAEEAAKEMEVLSNLKIERLERQRELIEEEREEAKEMELEKLKEREEEERKKREEKEKEKVMGHQGEEEDIVDLYREKNDTAKVLLDSSGGAKTYEEQDGVDGKRGGVSRGDSRDVSRGVLRGDSRSGDSGGGDEGSVSPTKLWELVLSKAEIEALESLATNSAVEAERGLLGKLKLLKREAEVADRLASERMRERERETEEREKAGVEEEEREKERQKVVVAGAAVEQIMVRNVSLF